MIILRSVRRRLEMRRNIISIVQGGPAPEEQLPVLKRTGWDGVFFPWTGQGTDRILASKIQAEGLVLQSVHAPFDRADKLWRSDDEGEAEVARQIRCIRDTALWGCGLVVMHAVIGMERIAPTDREPECGFENFLKIFDAAASAGMIVAMEKPKANNILMRLCNIFADIPAWGSVSIQGMKCVMIIAMTLSGSMPIVWYARI